jgi:hypothetical protein
MLFILIFERHQFFPLPALIEPVLRF